ncbi:unnamed protein product, partial [Polarella glacialis]
LNSKTVFMVKLDLPALCANAEVVLQLDYMDCLKFVNNLEDIIDKVVGELQDRGVSVNRLSSDEPLNNLKTQAARELLELEAKFSETQKWKDKARIAEMQFAELQKALLKKEGLGAHEMRALVAVARAEFDEELQTKVDAVREEFQNSLDNKDFQIQRLKTLQERRRTMSSMSISAITVTAPQVAEEEPLPQSRQSTKSPPTCQSESPPDTPLHPPRADPQVDELPESPAEAKDDELPKPKDKAPRQSPTMLPQTDELQEQPAEAKDKAPPSELWKLP